LNKDQEEQAEQSKSPFKKVNYIWWLILIGLIIWNLMTFLPKVSSEANIPYSTFLEQVREDNVSGIQIDGDKITGEFVKPFEWASNAPVTQGPTPKKSAVPPEEKIKPTTTESYSKFITIFPQDVGDPNLLPLLEKHDVEVDVVTRAHTRFTEIIISVLPFLLLVVFFIWMGRQAVRNQSSIFRFGRSQARRYTAKRPSVTFADVAGATEAKAQLQQEVDFLSRPEKYHKLGARIPRGVLLLGPPGTGKTLMARAVAGEAKVPFFNISASEFVEMFVGVGASRVRDLFNQAKEAAPSIIFIDELDAVARRRGAGMGTVNDEREQTLNQLLVEMDGFDEKLEVIVMAATNRPDVLDPALLRPGRFDRQVVIGLPDREGREGILKIHTKPLTLSESVDLNLLARITTGMSGADLSNLCNEAAISAAKNDRNEVTMPDFEEALDKISLGEKRQVILDQTVRRVIAYHEAGHALVAWFTPNADPVHKVTIIPHGLALGATKQLPMENQYNYSRAYLISRILVLLGGRTAEEIATGEVSTGAENDLVEATRLARRMVTRWGMSNLGLLTFKTDEEQPFLGYELSRGRDYSEATAALIDQEIKRLLDESHENVRDLLTAKVEKLHTVAHALLENETIEQPVLKDILGPRPEDSVNIIDLAKETYR
jgi:cell division protease FtsH